MTASFFCLNIHAMKKTQKPSREASRKKRKKDAISGFSTLNQVAGVSKPRVHHSSLSVDEPKIIREPLPQCAFCSAPIESIAESFMIDDGRYVHFDCAVKHIREMENIPDDKIVSYIGSGNFGIIEKGDDGKFTILKTIPFENSDRVRSMKAFVEGCKV